MYQAIRTKFLAPTNHRGARIKATAASGQTKTVAYNHALNQLENHTSAAHALAYALGWDDVWVGGNLDECGFVYVRLAGSPDPGTLGTCGQEFFFADESPEK